MINLSKSYAHQAWINHFQNDLRLAHPTRFHVLGGLRFAVKDNIDVAGVTTTVGCPDYAYIPKTHAFAVQRLLEAGAGLAGKTNLDQFACGLNGTRSPYGVVPNAFNDAYISGGSSSGSAYVVATGQVDFALGTDTAGSGRVPAALNNIVGLKPSRGLISTRGVVPAAQSLDCVSIFARNVQTAWKAFEVVRGYDPLDPYSRELPLHRTAWIGKVKIGVPDKCEWFGDLRSKAAFDESIERARDLGAEIIEIPYQPFLTVASLLYESALGSERINPLLSLLQANPEAIDPAVRKVIEPAEHYSGADVFKALSALKELEREIRPIWKSIDVLMVPTVPRTYLIEEMLDHPIEFNRHLGYYTNFVNLLDYAAIAIPSCIRSDGLPFGVTFIAPCGSDWQLADWGLRFHQKSSLCLGTSSETVSSDGYLPAPAKDVPMTSVVVVGAHLTGMPLNRQLLECGAHLVQKTQTSASYRLYALANTAPPKPGLLRVPAGTGEGIEVEVWSMPTSAYGGFVAGIPAPLGIGQIELKDGSSVQGFICEHQATEGAKDISEFKGWKAYLARSQT